MSIGYLTFRKGYRYPKNRKEYPKSRRGLLRVDTVDKVFSSRSNERFIRELPRHGNNVSPKHCSCSFRCTNTFSDRLYQQYRS